MTDTDTDTKQIQWEPKYGLPSEVKFCRSCVISNQRPNSAVEFQHQATSKKATISLDKNNVCDACKVAEEKRSSIDWAERELQLRELCNKYRKSDGSYDCLIPGSGGKDSFYQAHVLKYRFGMNPLTVTWAPHIYTDWGWNNFQSWLGAGFDNYLHTPNPRMHRLLTRLAVENLFHPFQPFMLGQKSFAPKMAAMLDIPLIFYGENEAEYGNPRQDLNEAQRSWDYFSGGDFSKIYLGGVSVERLYADLGVSKGDLEPYFPIRPETLRNKNIEVHYLGYYLPWHPQGAYYYAVEHGGFIPAPERSPGTYSKYNSIDDKIDDFHYYTTFIKFGIGRATYDASQEIRNEEITRDEGVALVKKYDGEFPARFSDEIFRYLSISEREYPKASGFFDSPIIDRDYFDDLADKFRSPHLWVKERGSWQLRHAVWHANQGGECRTSG
jgi:N-acetyl sugar amidotransferase